MDLHFSIYGLFLLPGKIVISLLEKSQFSEILQSKDHQEYDAKVRLAISSPSFSEVQKKNPQKTIGPCGMINASATTTTLKSSCFESNLIVIMR